MKAYRAYSKVNGTPVIDEDFGTLIDFIKAEILASEFPVLDEPGDQIIIEKIEIEEDEYAALPETEGLYS